MIVLGRGAFGREYGHEGEASMIEVSALLNKSVQNDSSFLLPGEDTEGPVSEPGVDPNQLPNLLAR